MERGNREKLGKAVEKQDPTQGVASPGKGVRSRLALTSGSGGSSTSHQPTDLGVRNTGSSAIPSELGWTLSYGQRQFTVHQRWPPENPVSFCPFILLCPFLTLLSQRCSGPRLCLWTKVHTSMQEDVHQGVSVVWEHPFHLPHPVYCRHFLCMGYGLGNIWRALLLYVFPHCYALFIGLILEIDVHVNR